jgi:Protein of unknown function (DUF3667)
MTQRELTPLQAAADPWTCPTCNSAVRTPHCPTCGERFPDARDLTLRSLFKQLISAFTEIDGRLIHSFRCAVMQPGDLTVAFQRGQRKSFLMPLQMFFIANVFFFAMQALTGAKIFSTPLESHLRNDIWGPVAQHLVTRHLAALHSTAFLYAPVFNHAVAVNSKSLIILMAMSFALLLPIVFLRNRCPFVVHVVFSLHLYVFVLLLFCLALTVAGADTWFGGAGLDSPDFDHTLSVILLLACAVYLYKAIGTVYGARGSNRVLKVMILTVALAGIVLAYRFVLLPITLYTT